MKSKLATMASLLVLVGGTGGAVAIAGTDNGNGNGGQNNGAAGGQYAPGKGCGDQNHTHTGPPGNPSNTSCPPQSGHARDVTKSKTSKSKTKHVSHRTRRNAKKH